MIHLVALGLLAQITVPDPRGFVNDFAGVIPAAAATRMEALLQDVQEKTRGDIAVVTLADIGGHAASDVALRIGRQWKLGGIGEAGTPGKDLGVVVLLVPRKNHQPGTGDLFITTGRGAEGFLPDGRVGRIRDAMVPYLAREDYGGGLEVGVGLLARAFADEYHVRLDSTLAEASPPQGVAEPRLPPVVVGIVVLLVLLIFLSAASRAAGRGRRRRGWWTGGGWGGGFGEWGGWGGGGGGGGGFGGFGGGGGFSGGGAGGKF